MDKNKWANCIQAVRWARVQFWGVRRSTSERHRHHPRTTIAHSRHTGAGLWRGEAGRRGGSKQACRAFLATKRIPLSLSSILLIFLFCHFPFLHCISLLRIVSWFFFCLPILCNEAVGVVVSRVCGVYNFEKLRECFVDVVVLFSSRTGSGSALT